MATQHRILGGSEGGGGGGEREAAAALGQPTPRPQADSLTSWRCATQHT